MNRIINKNISSLEFIELREEMQEMVEQSMKALDSHNGEYLMWFKDCAMDDYFHEWAEICDEYGIKIGEGIVTIAHEFILNDDTRSDFEAAFEQARDSAIEQRIKEIAEEVEEYESDEEVGG